MVQGGKPEVQIGSTSKQPTLDVAPETFVLRKLLPQTADYDFNVHIMDFKPGEYLYVKVCRHPDYNTSDIFTGLSAAARTR